MWLVVVVVQSSLSSSYVVDVYSFVRCSDDVVCVVVELLNIVDMCNDQKQV